MAAVGRLPVLLRELFAQSRPNRRAGEPGAGAIAALLNARRERHYLEDRAGRIGRGERAVQERQARVAVEVGKLFRSETAVEGVGVEAGKVASARTALSRGSMTTIEPTRLAKLAFGLLLDGDVDGEVHVLAGHGRLFGDLARYRALRRDRREEAAALAAELRVH